MKTPSSVDELLALYEEKGSEFYGEQVTTMMHAVQCAELAKEDGASDELVAAALLHDVGHLVVDQQGRAGFSLEEDNDDHEAIGARILAPLFGPRVAQPVALHVTAKRWRCTREPHYYEGLSTTSKATLKAQGGLLSEEECLRFEAHPGFNDALRLRTWDDLGKDAEQTMSQLGDYAELLRRLANTFR
jgi:phosphonate degradation associated HDIG domain protein